MWKSVVLFSKEEVCKFLNEKGLQGDFVITSAQCKWREGMPVDAPLCFHIFYCEQLISQPQVPDQLFQWSGFFIKKFQKG